PQHPARGDGIPLGADVLDRELEVGQGGAEHPEDLPVALAAGGGRGEGVVDVAGGDELVHHRRAVLVEDLLDEPAVQRLEVGGGHRAPSSSPGVDGTQGRTTSQTRFGVAPTLAERARTSMNHVLTRTTRASPCRALTD